MTLVSTAQGEIKPSKPAWSSDSSKYVRENGLNSLVYYLVQDWTALPVKINFIEAIIKETVYFKINKIYTVHTFYFNLNNR